MELPIIPVGYRVVDKVAPALNAAIKKHGNDEKIAWESGIVPAPDGSAAVAIIFWLPGAVLGTYTQGSFTLADPVNIDPASIEQTVAEFLRQLREARSQQLAKDAPQGAGRPTLAQLAQQMAQQG